MVDMTNLQLGETNEKMPRPSIFPNRLLHKPYWWWDYDRVWKRTKRKVEIFLLLIIGSLSFLLRLFSVIRNEAIIHEYDPYFNYKMTKILNEKGFYKFWNYFDVKSWFPFGRTTGQTLFPGLMIISMIIYNICHSLGFLVDIRNVCIYMGPIFSFFTCIISYLLTKEVYHNSGAALISSLFVSISPSHISRTVAGSYDNESVSIFLLLLCIYNWIRCLKKGTALSALICSISTYCMALSWGAYIFVTNAISLFMLIIIILKRCTVNLCIVYNVYYVLTTVLCLNIPSVNRSVFVSIEHLATHAIYIICSLLLVSHFVISHLKLDEEILKKLSWNHRSRTLLDPTYASKHNPIVASISEHQPTTWASYLFDIHLVLLFLPIGLYHCFKEGSSMELFFLGIFTSLCLYFSSLMVRLLLIFSPFASILSAVGLSSLINRLVALAKVERRSCERNDRCEQSDKAVGSIHRAEKNIASIMISLCALFLLASLVVFLILHATWCSSIAYSESNITFYSRNKSGDRYINDDIRQMYKWIANNTEEDAKIVAWWDYGYQLSVMSDRITYVDNNTWNYDHIATVGLILSSNEKHAYEQLKKLDADYVLVSYGGYSKNSSDDLNKFIWILKITSKKYNFVNPLLYYYHEKYHPLGKNATQFMTNSVLYKLSYYNITHDKVTGYDYVRKMDVPEIKNLSYFEEVFTSDVWGFRLYKFVVNFLKTRYKERCKRRQKKITNSGIFAGVALMVTCLCSEELPVKRCNNEEEGGKKKKKKKTGWYICGLQIHPNFGRGTERKEVSCKRLMCQGQLQFCMSTRFTPSPAIPFTSFSLLQ
ncbi:dolichyl-diphosphooligosaccharide--protein glycosyltransferase subunit STT3, putative (STT3) [Plasmodium ovale curtisi]|uniref:dolichyl-diphosphooligosaccharide--protein glycotransferase n=1 Tax=Plasmodium ovale curtisi TaxID=864141 RepID=A0A1A8VXC9_PLAOA|nr:dolichyl-diphosphooligosaccharide--protein glycosyltransferase subunit STT3, putative (STT3) [Plasmodium ovale curtisi]